MINSMTAFGRKSSSGEWGQATWEIRSVNHRYLDLSIYLPEGLSLLEPLVRAQVKQHIKRGKVECRLKCRFVDQADAFGFNQTLVKQLVAATAEINKICTQDAQLPAQVDAARLLSWPGVLLATEVDVDDLTQPVMALFAEALTSLGEMRAGEGAALLVGFNKRLDEIDQQVAVLQALQPQITHTLEQNLRQRILMLTESLDETRLLQEVAISAQKLDIAEELDRLTTHVSAFREILARGGVIGRRLDFLLQELNREANTLASKSTTVNTSHTTVELKVLIEQIREQVQNIE